MDLKREDKTYIWLIVIAASNMLGFYQILSKYTQVYFSDMICLILGVFAFFYLFTHRFRDLKSIPRIIRIKSFGWFLFLWSIIEILVTVIKYGSDQQFSKTIQSSLFCIVPSLLSFYMIQLGKKEFALDYIELVIIRIGTMCSVIAIIAYYLLVRTGNNFFNLDVQNYSFMRNGRPHYMIGTMVVVPATIFLLNNMIKKKVSIKLFICIFLNLFHIVYIGQSRSLISYVLITFGVSFLVSEKRNKVLRWIVIVLCVLAFILTQYSLITSFSDELISSNSYLYRVEAIKFYIDQLIKNPLFGMGFIANSNHNLAALLYGSLNRYYRTDVGVIGFINCVGVFGIVWVIGLFLYCYNIAKAKNNGNMFENNRLNFYTFLFFLAISSINLFFLENYRILYFPLLSAYVSAFEFQSNTNKNDELKGVQ